MFLKRVEWRFRCSNVRWYRLFHACGPATANARSPMVERRVEGTTRSADDTERRRRQAVLATGTASSVKYRGAAPVRQRCMSTHSLNFTRSGTHSQWSSLSSDVTWSYLRASADRWAAALTTDYTLSSSRCGRPAKTTLQNSPPLTWWMRRLRSSVLYVLVNDGCYEVDAKCHNTNGRAAWRACESTCRCLSTRWGHGPIRARRL